jgi:methylenetetrahydrofolate--tRNA-(uracil-5-)-methyltransferase
MQSLLGESNLYFYDAIAPLLAASSLDHQKIFLGSRYQKGDPAYLNCPMDKNEYLTFHDGLLSAQTVSVRPFEEKLFFEACLPVEELARRGPRTLAFGPMKAVGLLDPRTGRRPYAVVQLRQDNAEATVYNMVGFQTRLRRGEQERIFRLIPGLEQAEFLRYGSVHRNTFVCGPRILQPTMQTREDERVFLAGQITGGEGYVESVTTGLLAGLNLARVLGEHEPVVPPRTTAAGSLCRYLAQADGDHFQPMNVNFGLLPSLDDPPRNREQRNQGMAQRALRDLSTWIDREEMKKGAHHREDGQAVSHLTCLGEELFRKHR